MFPSYPPPRAGRVEVAAASRTNRTVHSLQSLTTRGHAPRRNRTTEPNAPASKNGTASKHPLLGDELRALRRLQRESVPSPFVFVSERGTPFTTAGFARMIERGGAPGSRP
jgi:hypothetical protein